jgi:conjugal transfer pilin signal peptidase TrbI
MDSITSAVSPRHWLQRRRDEIASLVADMRRRWWLYAAYLAALTLLNDRLLVNITPSLPYTVVLIERGVPVQLGDLVIFRYEGAMVGAYRRGQRFFKILAGVPGDTISVEGRNVFVNGQYRGYAKQASVTGVPLTPIEPGVIPEGRYYVQGTGPDSFDSRYQENGLIRTDQIIGKAHAIF